MKELQPRDWGEVGKGNPHLPRNWDCSVCNQVFWPAAAKGSRFKSYLNHHEMNPPADVIASFEAHDCSILLGQKAAKRERPRKNRNAVTKIRQS